MNEGVPHKGTPFSLESTGGLFYINSDGPPFTLQKPCEAQAAACYMPSKDRDPNVNWLESGHLLYDETDAKGNDHLRDNRYVQRAFCVAATLQPASVGESNRNKQARKRHDAK